MADPTFCSIEDLEKREPDIQDLAPDSGNLNDFLAEARKEIEDRLLTSLIVTDLDKLGATVQPRQLRLPAIYKTLSMVYFAAARDEESPYFSKYEEYKSLFDDIFSSIKVLDLDQDEDGTIEENEKNSQRVWTRRMRRT
jgi:hypothetical protein